jgi:hypothetical protein
MYCRRKNISFNCNPGSYASGGASAGTGGTKVATPTPTSTPTASSGGDRIVYYTPVGKSYHYSKDCPTLARSKTILQGKLSDVIKYNMKKVHVISFPVFYLCDLKTRHLAKFKLCNINPIDAVSKTATPTMFIHGSKDDFILPKMSCDMYKAKKGIKALYIAEGAVHACSIKVDKKRYYEEVYKFLDKVYPMST